MQKPYNFLSACRPLLWAPLALLAACASSKDSSTESTHRSLSQRLNETVQFEQDAEGKWAPSSDRRSSFESQGRSPYFKGSVEKKPYQSTAFEKKPFWGKRAYAGKADFQVGADGNRFHQSSELTQGRAPESQQSASTPGSYATSGVATHHAREATAKRLNRPADAETDIRRRVFTQPQVLNSRSGRTMSVEQTNSILGR